MKTFLLLFFSLLFSNNIVLAGTTGKITGKAADAKTGEPLIGVNIILENQSIGAATDINGEYFILNVPPGEYILIASMIGYQSVRVTNVQVITDKTTNINITLEEKTVTLNEEVVVTATRPLIKKDLTSSELSVSKDEIKNLPVESIDDILKIKAGVVADANGGIHIRGGRTSEVGYMIDGISMTDKYAGSQNATVDVQFLEEVKIISGVFNAEYGQAMSGIIEIITKQGQENFGGQVSVSSGDYLTQDDRIFLGIEKINPVSIYDAKINFAGPLNIFNSNLKYNIAFRRFYNEGWLYGKRRFNPSDSSFQQGELFYIQETGDNKILSLNSFLNNNFQAKINFDLSNDIKISNLFLFDKSESQSYDHLYKYNPDGWPKNYNDSYNNIFTLTYLFSSRTFLNLKYSLRYDEHQEYVYEDINDARYVNPELLRQLTAYSFLTGGTDMRHNKRQTTTHTAKMDILSQVDRLNELKTGLELNYHKIFRDNKTVKYQDTIRIFDLNRFFNEGEFTHKPLYLAAYIQDKIEFESIIINAGIRYDYFNSFGWISSDPKDPENSPKIKSKAQHQVSPRLGVAFPISADGSLHFSYGHFFQIPPLEFLYANPNFRVGPGGLYTLMGNTNLKAQSTIAYEVGLHYKFFDIIGLELIGFYKDISNLLGTEIQDTYIRSDRYAVYANRDYGKTRGFTISLFKRETPSDNISASIDYTLQIAEGNASDPRDAYNRAQGTPPKKVNIQVIPLDWDQRHTINLSLFYIIPNNINIGIIAKYESGFPYTPVIQSVETSFENNARMPAKTNVDLQINKDISIGDFSFSLFARVFNLFDQRSEIDVFKDTGRAGYSLVSQYTPEYQSANTLSEFLIRPDYYSEPRRILVGISYNFNY